MSKSHLDRFHTGATTDNYRDNYDNIFKKKDKAPDKKDVPAKSK